jgi:hypothetical protein
MICEIIQNVGYENYDNFHHVNFIISQKIVSLFWGLFDDEIDPRVKVGTLQTTYFISVFFLFVWNCDILVRKTKK